MKKFKKMTALVLTLAMLISMVTVSTAMAEETEADSTTEVLFKDDFSTWGFEDEDGELFEEDMDLKNDELGTKLKVGITDGNTVEYAYDSVTEKWGLKLRVKKTGSGYIDFNYLFDKNYTDGEYTVKVDQRIEYHSVAHNRWPALLKDCNSGGESYSQSVVYSDGYCWYNNIGGSRWIGGNTRSNIQLIGKVTPKVSYQYMTSDGGNSGIKETTTGTLGGVLLRMTGANSVNGGNREFPGTPTADDEENSKNKDGIAWIYGVSLEKTKRLVLSEQTIKNGDVSVKITKPVKLTFSAPVSDDFADSITLKKGIEELVQDMEYKIERSTDKKTLTISPINAWDYESTYTLTVGNIKSANGYLPYEGLTVRFSTEKENQYLIYDDFSTLGLNVGQTWTDTGSGTTVKLSNEALGTNLNIGIVNGSVEYAYDEKEEKYGLKLRTSKTNGWLDFNYMFDKNYSNGEFTVSVDSKIENHSAGHNRWPALLADYKNGGEAYNRAIVYSDAGAWIDNIGEDRWLGGVPRGTNLKMIGKATPGVEVSYATSLGGQSKTVGISAETLGGVDMRMQGGEYNSGAQLYPGTQTDEDTVNNPNNDGIAWIYGVTLEQTCLEVASTSFENSVVDFDPSNTLTLTFNKELDPSTVNLENIQLWKNDNQIDNYEATINISADGKTVSILPVMGLEYSTTYTIKVSKAVKAKDSVIGDLRSQKTYSVRTIEYEDTVNPDIKWSTIPDGSVNIDPETEYVILRTDVLLDSDTVNKTNVKLYENDTAVDNYTVAKSGNEGIKISFTDGLNKGSKYKIAVSGLKSGGENRLEMTSDYSMTFTVREDIFAKNIISKISPDGTKSVITAELHNETAESVKYQVIGALKTADDKVLDVVVGSSGTVAANQACDISVEASINENAKLYDLYIWDGVGSMKPLAKKAELTPVSVRTYGYDNYADSSKNLTATFIGGSITQQGQYTTPLKSALSTWLKENNSERKITFTGEADNGIGGTGSSLGLYRLEKDVISAKPDIVFIEFAVNDAGDSNTAKTTEGMIRKLMKLDHQPMVIFLDLTTSNYGSENSVAAWEPLMEAYGIGYVNIAPYIKENEASETNPTGKYIWKSDNTYPNATVLTGDGTHPGSEGGKIYSDYIMEQFKESPSSYFKKMNYVASPVTENEYRSATMVSWKEATFDENWDVATGYGWAFDDQEAASRSTGASLTFEFTGSTIGLYLGKYSGGPSASYVIDGEITGTVGSGAGNTTKMPMSSMIKTDLSAGKHTITITANDKDFKFGYFIVD